MHCINKCPKIFCIPLKKVMQVFYNMRLNKWWQDDNFRQNCACVQENVEKNGRTDYSVPPLGKRGSAGCEYLTLAPEAPLLQTRPDALDSPSMLWVVAVVSTCTLVLQHLGVINQTCTHTHIEVWVSVSVSSAAECRVIGGDGVPVVKRGWLWGGSGAMVRGKALSGSVSEVEAGDDCVRESGRWAAPSIMGTASVSIWAVCLRSCWSCFCVSHRRDCKESISACFMKTCLHKLFNCIR